MNFGKVIVEMNRMGRAALPFLFVIDYEMNDSIVLPLDQAAKNGFLFNMRGYSNYVITNSDDIPLQFSKYPIDFDTYRIAFDKIIREIRFGNTFLINLTFPTEIKTNWSLRRIFEKSHAPYKLLSKDGFVLYSPESFVTIKSGIISAYPMKGTYDATIQNASENLLSDPKEKAEHATIVDLLRNDLSIVAKNVTVERYRYLEEVLTSEKGLLQVSSKISGLLPTNYMSNLGNIIGKLLPAGSICGAPKASTLKIIKDVENYQRGFYTGVFGIFDGINLDSAVMIRYIEQSDNKLIYKSGGGITMQSDVWKEYKELIDKVYVPTY